jgi:type II secretory pathway pseudopilin PulG
MRQQINLYQPVAGDESKTLEARTLGFLAGGVVMCLLVIWGFGMTQVASLEKSVEALRAQQQAQETAMSQLGAQHPNAVTPATLQAQVAALSAQVAARTQALDFLRHGGVGQTHGFAERLEALARRHTDGLWIDRVVLSGTTGAMSVGGSTVNPDLVPRYLRQLAGESALSGARFDALTIERPSFDAAPSKDKPAQPIDRKGIRFRAESNSLRAADPEKAS